MSQKKTIARNTRAMVSDQQLLWDVPHEVNQFRNTYHYLGKIEIFWREKCRLIPQRNFQFLFFVCVHLKAHENESENASWSPKKVIQHQKSHQHFTVFTGLASGRKTEGVTKKLRAFSRKVIGKPEIARFIGLGDPRRRLWEPLNPRPN